MKKYSYNILAKTLYLTCKQFWNAKYYRRDSIKVIPIFNLFKGAIRIYHGQTILCIWLTQWIWDSIFKIIFMRCNRLLTLKTFVELYTINYKLYFCTRLGLWPYFTCGNSVITVNINRYYLTLVLNHINSKKSWTK